MRGRFVSIEAVSRAWGAIAESFRETALSIPGKIATMCAMKPREEVEPIINDEIYELLERLAGGDEIRAADGEDRHDQRRGAARLLQAKISQTVIACMRADALIAGCLDYEPEERDELQGRIDLVKSEVVLFCRRIEMSAPFRCADDVASCMRSELEPVRDALQAALDLLNDWIAARDKRKFLI
jgi:hypothetical protein